MLKKYPRIKLYLAAIDFLEKPVDFTTLIAMVEKYSIVKSQIA